MSNSSLYPKEVTLTNCDKEPIHILGKIQSCGYLISADASTHIINYCSENVEELLGIACAEVLGVSLSHFFEDSLITVCDELEDEEKAIPQNVSFENNSFLAVAHKHARNIIIELEHLQIEENPYAHQIYLSTIVSELNAAETEQEMCDLTAGLIRDYYGYDRVMIYRFDENWDGIVISEEKNEDMESWLGLRYPASDIPQQARKLFLKQGVRIIANVTSKPVPIQALSGKEQDNPVDLTHSEYRASSPIHIEYLENMGVGASLTAAIISKGTLWGLIACHHNSPKFISYYKRQSCKYLTQVLSSRIILSTANTALQKINESAFVRNKLLEKVSKDWEILQGLVSGDYTMMQITDAYGAAIFLDKNLKTVGITPEEGEIRALIKTLSKADLEDNYYYSNSLGKDFSKYEALKSKASGVLCVFLSAARNDALLWFKPEKVKTVNWAGNPEKPVNLTDNQRLSPRKSFEKWSVLQEGQAEPWADYEITAALALKQDISEIILQKYEEVKQLNSKLQSAYEDLETFSYSVAHDLRAPLRGIDGFAQIIKEDYNEELDDFGKSSVQTIIDSADRMNLLIDDILEFSRVTQANLTRTKFSLETITKDLVQFINVSKDYPNTKIEISAELPVVEADQKMVTQVMQNLLTNALKYSASEEQPHIEIGVEELKGTPFFYVRDNGIGFDAKRHEGRIFKLFSRLVGKEYPGSGVGLTIVKRIIKKHNGKLKVKSKPKEGSTFFFTLN